MSDYQIMLAVLTVLMDIFLVWLVYAGLFLFAYGLYKRFVQRRNR